MRTTYSRSAGARGALLTLVTGILTLAGAAAAINAPPITYPTSGSALYSGTPTLQWSAATGATWYRVYLSQGSSGPSILPCANNKGAVDPKGCWLQGSLSLAVTNPLPLGAYTLWVMAYSASGTAWSPPTPFTVATRFEDRGKTVFDHQTNLEWEKKTADGSIHDGSNTYSWSAGTNNPDGTAFTLFLAGLNAGPCVSASADGTTVTTASDCSFGGHGDWRLPKVSELSTILDCSFAGASSVCINPVFGPTPAGNPYWTSSSLPNNPQNAWTLFFTAGSGASQGGKVNAYYVRAVRSGP